MDTARKNGQGSAKFESISQADVPKGRDGKHKQIILQIIEAIEQSTSGSALKISLADLPDSKENIRSALNRVTKQRQLNVATSSDEHYLYVWKNGA